MTLKELLKHKNKKILFDYIKKSTSENNGKECQIKIGFNKNNHLVLVKSVKLYSSAEAFTENIFNICEFVIVDGQVLTEDVGYCSFFEVNSGDSSHLYLNLIKVNSEKYLGLGYGSLMMRNIEEYARNSGVKQICGTFLPLPPGNRIKSRRFYINNGFDFRHVVDEPNYAMESLGFNENYSYTEIYKYKEDFRHLRTIEYDGFDFIENIFNKKTFIEQINED